MNLNLERIAITSAFQLPAQHPKVSRLLIFNKKIMLLMLGRARVSKLNSATTYECIYARDQHECGDG